MTGDDFKRIFRALFLILVSVVIMFIGNLPTDFTNPSMQISPWLFAWCGAFIICRPGSAGIFSILIVALLYAVYNDEGVALGAFALLMFCLIVQELREYFEFQSFPVEWVGMSLLFFAAQLGKNLILHIFFTNGFTIFELLKFTLIFAILYPIFNFIIQFTVGRRDPNRANDE